MIEFTTEERHKMTARAELIAYRGAGSVEDALIRITVQATEQRIKGEPLLCESCNGFGYINGGDGSKFT